MPVKKEKQKSPGRLTVSELRAQIDFTDTEILDLINNRASTALLIAEAKKKISKTVYDRRREKEIEKKVALLNRGPLSDESAVSIFRAIISSCRTLQYDGRVSYLGPEGSFSHQAAVNMFGSKTELVPVRTLGEVFEAVSQETVSAGVVPIENSTEGAVGDVLEVIALGDFRITGERFEKINHFLLSKTGGLKNIRKVASHPQALAQCAKWLSSKLPEARQVDLSSTAAAAALAAKDKNTAAVSSLYSSKIYNLKVAGRNIEDNPVNATRFVTVEKATTSSSAAEGNKVSISFSIKDRPGALHKTLFFPLASAGVNLTRIESRPSGNRAWEYNFFVDFEGSVGQRKTDKLLERIEAGSSSFKVLGCYFSGKRSG